VRRFQPTLRDCSIYRSLEINVLGANYVGVIVPTKFSRVRIWNSLGMTPKARLLARFMLPQDSFVDPSNQKSVNIQSNCLLFGLRESVAESTEMNNPGMADRVRIRDSFYLHGKRDKGDFPGMATSDLVRAAAVGLSKAVPDHSVEKVQLASEREAELPLLVKLQNSGEPEAARLELWLLLNPERPLSLANATSCRVAQHSVGWMSTYVKPHVTNTMLEIALCTKKNPEPSDIDCALVGNLMSGEGTSELEAQQYAARGNSFLLLSGDKSEGAAMKIQQRLLELQRKNGGRNFVDMVIWDVHHLPIRRDVVDLFIADLPIAGSKAKEDQRRPLLYQ